MKKIVTALLTLIICMNAIGQTPVITMTTTKAIGSTFSINLYANANNTSIQIDNGDGNLINTTIGTFPMNINITLVGSQIVKIYGIGIAYLNCYNCQLIALDVTKISTLNGLHCSNNQLSTLDVSKNIALTDLNCPSNQLTTLDVTQNTFLIYLDCGFNKLTSLDLTKNIALIDIRCHGNQLTELNVTKNVAITYLNCFSNQLTTLDITKNKALQELYSAYNRITALDISQNTKLTDLSCNSNQITTLNLIQNANLNSLYCSSNLLTTLDLSQNTKLKTLECDSNRITALDVTKDTALAYFYCNSNNLNFSTIPIKQTSWIIYKYSPQNRISIIKTLKTNTELDLSSQLTANGNTTTYTWKTKSGATLLQGTDYTLTDGKIIFLKAQSDSVYCEMTNATFQDFTGSDMLKTTYTKITSGTAVTDMNTPDIEIYAYRNTLYINIPYNAQVSIFEPTGRFVVSKPVYSGSNSLQLQNNGIYLVKLIGNKGSVTKKINIE